MPISTSVFIRLSAVCTLSVLAACAGGPPGPAATPSTATSPATAASAAAASLPAATAPRPSLAALQAGPAASAPVVATAPAPPAPGQPPPFAIVIRDAKQIDGLFTLHQKDERVWIELRPEDFNKPFYFSPKLARGIGEGRIFGGTMVGSFGSRARAQVVEFERVHNQVRLVARNQQYIAEPGSPQARSVAAGFSSSLLSSSGVVSQPHPQRKSVLVDASPLFLGDLLGLGSVLQRAYRQAYALDGRHTHFTQLRGQPREVVFNVQAHYATASLAMPLPGAPPGAPVPTLPVSLPDARSMFIGLHYSIAKLPEQVMRTRPADPRLGYFTSDVHNFSDEAAASTKLRHINRWRLEKKDPAAELSEPVKPIVFWLDRSVPLKYRETVTRGILEWNKAFEKIGFKGAIEARQQDDQASFDTLDVGVASVRFISSASPAFDGFGPSITDPRSGEILDADIVLDGNLARTMRGLRAQVLNRDALQARGIDAQQARGIDADDMPSLMQLGGPGHRADGVSVGHAHADGALCDYAAQSAEAFSYALDVLDARGELPEGSALPEQFALQRVFAVTMHEVGHALGLRHNFRASKAVSLAQLADPAFTAAHGTSGSVMDYSALNIPPPGAAFDQHGSVHRSALGAYDYWAIEYGYRPLAAAEETAELQRIASRSGEPALAFGTDEDASLGIDPETLTFTLGNDPLAFAQARLAIAKDLIARQESRQLSQTTSYAPLRRAVRYAVRDVASATGVLARQIGGVRTLRDFPGSGRDPIQPVPAALQRAALEMLAQQVLSMDSLRLSPALQRKLAPDFLDRGDDTDTATEYSVTEAVLALQRTLLGQLMSDTVASRILENEGRFEPETGATAVAAGAAPGAAAGLSSAAGGASSVFHLAELYARLSQVIWRELDSPRPEISALRRELQREHVNRLAAQLLRPSVQSRSDARAQMREQARSLLPRLQAALKRSGLSATARVHLADAADTLSQALAAPLQRQSL